MNGRAKRRAAFAGAAVRLARLLAAVLAAALLAAGLLVLFRSLVNRVFLVNYENGNYSAFPEELLLPMRWGENYVVPANMGNTAYQNGDYGQAVMYYRDALNGNPPEEGKECAIRVNLALAMLHMYPFDTMNPQDAQQIDEALRVLISARAVLTEHGCACEASGAEDGHSEQAETLKRDIDEMIGKLMKTRPDSPAGRNDSGGLGGEGDSGQSRQDDETRRQNLRNAADETDKTRQEKQKSLEARLKEQKQNLETGASQGGRDRDFTYIRTGETVGYGEGTPW